jgi:hypothetical protein
MALTLGRLLAGLLPVVCPEQVLEIRLLEAALRQLDATSR